MARAVHDLIDRSKLDDPAEIHHRNAVGEKLRDPEIMRDEDERDLLRTVQRLDQIEDLGAYGDVELRHRLVGDDQARRQGQRPRDGGALQLTAGHLMRVAMCKACVETHPAQQIGDPFGNLLLGHLQLQAQRQRDRGTDGEARVERGQRVLEHHLQIVRAMTARRCGLRGLDRDAPGGERVETEHRLAERGLARAGLPEKCDDLPFVHVERNVVQDAEVALGAPGLADLEFENGIPNADERRGAHRQHIDHVMRHD